ncbi:MAG: NAD(+) diphosphatase [Pseudomonadota bacterium]
MLQANAMLACDLNTAPYAIAFAGNPLNRHSEDRPTPGWLETQLSAQNAVFLPFFNGDPLIIEGAPAYLQMGARTAFPGNPPMVFLGIDPRQHPPSAVFALDASAEEQDARAAPFADLGRYENLREVAGVLSPPDLAIAGQARWLLSWHRGNGFCARCGNPTAMADGGAKRRCDACGTDHFPRTEPVAIVLVTHGEDCLLGRGPNFPPGFMSALAGFAEAGETLEECAIREIHEEAGVRIKSVRYQFSQPWPFPASLMMGCFAIAEDKTLTLDRTEIEDARWVSRETLKQLLNGDQHTDIRIPPDFTIAHHLIKRWAEEA